MHDLVGNYAKVVRKNATHRRRVCGVIVIASRIPPRPYSTEACHSGAACVGEQIMHSQELYDSCDEDCISSAGWLRCLPGLRSAHQALVEGLKRFRDPEFTLELLG